jgi:hypothetical protein
MGHKHPAWLLEYRSDVFSQKGEDGVVAKILQILPERDRWCVEFGAWDGKHLSNTRALIENQDYSAVLIEGSKERFRSLQSSCTGKRVYPVNAFVGFSAENGLDRILETIPIPVDFDFLSIDIDGNDFHAWNAVSKFTPKVVCIEFNPTIHTDVEFVQPADPSVNQGSSLSSIVRLGKDKGYELVSVLPFNAIFVREQYFHLFDISDNSPSTLRQDVSYVAHIFSGFDGRVILSGGTLMPWHRVRMREESVQQLPRVLQSFPGNYSLLQRLIFKVYRFFRG